MLLAAAACTPEQERGMQQVRVVTHPPMQTSCILTNPAGSWYVITPGNVKVRRTAAPMSITCNHMNYAGQVAANPQGNPWMAVASTVDGFTGPLYDYPSTIVVPIYPRQ